MVVTTPVRIVNRARFTEWQRNYQQYRIVARRSCYQEGCELLSSDTSRESR